jgi:hypothetical protein
MYIWSSATRRNFSRHLEIIMETTNVHFKSSRIVVQTLCFKNEHFLLKKLENHVFHRNIEAFFSVFLGTNYENTLFVDDTPYKSLFNPPFNAIFLETFYRPKQTIIPYLKPFSLTWKPCIPLVCKLNLKGVILLEDYTHSSF